MKFVTEKTRLGCLKSGETFMYLDEMYIVTDNKRFDKCITTCVNLETGIALNLSHDAPVIPIELVVAIKNKDGD